MRDKVFIGAFAFFALFALSFFIPQKLTVYNYIKKELIIPEKKIEIIAEVTMYNPVIEQTDDTPDINAMGLKVREGDVANNCFEFETKIEINDRIYTVRDRMNSRYKCNKFDILTFDKQEAKEFGRRILIINILNI